MVHLYLFLKKKAIDITDVFNILISYIQYYGLLPSVINSRAQHGDGTITETETAETLTACITPSIQCYTTVVQLLYNIYI